MRESLRRLAATSEEAMFARDKSGGKRRVRVELPDGEHLTLEVPRKSRGSDLLDRVCDSLDVCDERDYFGLLHTQRGDSRVWIDLNRRLSKTFRNEPWDARFTVKFYPPEPSEMRDENARYQLALTVRKDLMEGRLTCSSITMALLASYALQADCGDSAGPVSAAVCARVAPLASTDEDLLERIDELYRKHRGQSPAEAELNYLESAKRLGLYGSELHAARDLAGVELALAVSAAGLAVYRDGIQLNRFPWAKILKICYKKRSFTLQLRASEFDEFETHVSFLLPSSRACKKLWRISVEHHIFFRREAPVKVDRIVGFPRLGSRRLSCRRTLRQLRAEPATVGVAA